MFAKRSRPMSKVVNACLVSFLTLPTAVATSLATTLALGLTLTVALSSSAAHAGSADKAAAVVDPQPEKAAQLVRSMADALKTLNYEGTFVHVVNGNIETMRIMHSSDENGELERMTSLNGEAREVFRNNKTVTCIWPGSKSVIVSKSKPRDLLPKVDMSLVESQYYRLNLETPDRVAGRMAEVVHVAPIDNNRYGYRFWIDTESNMLLRVMLLDENDRGLEQVIFTDINYPDSIDPALLQAYKTDDSFSWQEPKQHEVLIATSPARVVEFSTLPGGYEKIAETYDAMPMSDSPLSHITLSDGMASVSVYVEYMSADKHDKGSAGISKMGAINAYGMPLGAAFVTVVGEVPAGVVSAIANSVLISKSDG